LRVPKAPKDKSAKPKPSVAPPSGAEVKAAKVAAPIDAALIRDVESKPRGIGFLSTRKVDLSHYMRWPKYIRLQRQRRILTTRMKIPPAVNQFTQTVDKNTATEVLRLLNKYRPEDKAAKKLRLKALAEKKAAAKGDLTKEQLGPKPVVVKFGLNHVTALIEAKKAKLVVIAHDVSPVEVVIWLPALCRKMDVPYCIIKGKSRLGTVVHHKTATAVAITNVNKEDEGALAKVIDGVKANFNDRFEEIRKQWGGGIMSLKTQHKVAEIAKAKAREAAVRNEA